MRIKQTAHAAMCCGLMAATTLAVGPATNPAGVIGAGDLVKVGIGDLIGPGVTTEVTVHANEAGKLLLPMLKSEVDVNGQTTDAAAVLISQAYLRAQVI